MKNLGMKLHPYKLRGEWVELCFMTRAAELGFHVTRPWGDSASYDVIVENEGRFARVQVKSTSHFHEGGYTCQMRGSNHHRYPDNSFDFLAVYLIPENVWYIMPAERTRGHATFYFRPKRRSKFNCYKEAWHLLKTGPTEGIVDVIHACVPSPAEEAIWGVMEM